MKVDFGSTNLQVLSQWLFFFCAMGCCCSFLILWKPACNFNILPQQCGKWIQRSFIMSNVIRILNSVHIPSLFLHYTFFYFFIIPRYVTVLPLRHLKATFALTMLQRTNSYKNCIFTYIKLISEKHKKIQSLILIFMENFMKALFKK